MRAKIIVEASSNHCGDIGLAKKMIKHAAECGADYIKFQSWQAKNLKANDPNYERHKKAELSDNDHYILMDECKAHNIEFLTSCFDIERIGFLSKLGLKSIKVPSTEFASFRMINLLKDKFDHIILSTGALTEEELDKTISLIKGKNFTLLHCMSIYPLPPDMANLARMNRLKIFTPSIGFSDHSLGADLAKAAIAMGAAYIEKHFTIDNALPGKDQAMSALPDVIKEIALYSKYIEKARGKEKYALGAQELKVRKEYIGKWGNNQ